MITVYTKTHYIIGFTLVFFPCSAIQMEISCCFFSFPWHKMAIIYLWGVDRVLINTNDSVISWLAAEISRPPTQMFPSALTVLEQTLPTHWSFLKMFPTWSAGINTGLCIDYTGRPQGRTKDLRNTEASGSFSLKTEYFICTFWVVVSFFFLFVYITHNSTADCSTEDVVSYNTLLCLTLNFLNMLFS